MVLFSLCLICSLFGIVVIASATSNYDSGAFKYVFVQAFSMIIGIGLFILLTVLDVDVLADFSEAMGHAGAIVRHPNGLFEGACDPRSNGAAAGF